MCSRKCWRLSYVTAEDFSRAADLHPVRGSRLEQGRALQLGEVRALFAACEDDDRESPPWAARDAAILAHVGDASQAALEAGFFHHGFLPGAINKGRKL